MYPYRYKIHPFMHGKIRVPIKVSPADGGTGTVFTNTLSAASRAGYSFDVQNKVGTTGIWNTWRTWKTEVTSLGVTFHHASAGPPRLRSGLDRNGSTATSAWSPSKMITIS